MHLDMIASYLRKIAVAAAVSLLPFVGRAEGSQAAFSSNLSSRDVQAFAQDAQGYIWMGTSHGLNRYNGTNYTTFLASSEEGALKSNNILSLTVDSRGRLWTGTECGIGYYEDGKFHHYSNVVYNPASQILELDENTVVGMGMDGPISFRKDDINTPVGRFFDAGASLVTHAAVSSNGILWLPRAAADSIFLDVLDHNLFRLKTFSLSMGHPVIGIAELPSNTIWVATERDIFCYNSLSRTSLRTPEKLSGLVDGKTILFLLPYRDSRLLLGLSGEGFFSYDISSGEVEHLVPEQKLPAKEYVCFVDKDNNIWLSDKHSEVYFYAARRPYTHLAPGGDSSDGSDISHLAFDSEGFLWMCFQGHLCSMDPSTGNIKWKSPGAVGRGGFVIGSDGLLDCISQDRRSVIQYRLSDGKAYPARRIPLSGEAFSIAEDVKGQLWLAMTRRLAIIEPDGTVSYKDGPEGVPFTLTLKDPVSRRVFLFTVHDSLYEILPDRTYRRIGGKELSSTDFVAVSKNGILWCGSYNEGVIRYDEATREKQVLDSRSGMVATAVKSMLEDDSGNIWIATSEHISRYDTTSRTFSILHDDRFSEGRSYNLVSAAKSPDGKLYFGGTGGITVIDPTMPIPERRDTPFNFESVTVNGVQQPSGLSRLRLGWKENSLSMRFSGIDFEAGALLSYAWRLEGFDRDWQYGPAGTPAIYPQVPPGTYTFRARIREMDGEWGAQELSLPIVIRPVPWASPWAIALYWILGIGVLVAGVVAAVRNRLQKSRLEVARQRDELKQQHIDFLTNISHEFRTPLSMIFGPAKELEKSDLGPHDKELVSLISRNARRLKVLTEQILSSSGGQQNRESLQLRKNDLSSLVRSSAGMFRYAASEKEQTVSEDLPESCIGWFDTEKVSKVLGNLLSNAVKYTPEGGHIHVNLRQEGGKACIAVEDDGIGVPEDQREKIFERFERAGAKGSGVEGSGIGLHYARSLAQLHRGTLTVEPAAEKGSIFRFVFPLEAAAYPDMELEKEATPAPSPAPTEAKANAQTILIAEDTADVRNFLAGLFSGEYNVITVSDGLEAMDRLKLSLPDLVLSDVVMPGKTGYSLCADIKGDPAMNHIPVILLTAKADADSSVEGMKAGADAYVGKPFDPDYLKAVVESILRNRRILQDKVLSLTSTSLKEEEKTEEVQLRPQDKALLEKVYAFLDAHLEEENTSVQQLAEEIGMSYSSLYAKLKSLTGKTPQAFVSNYRMNIAMELLRSGQYNVSEVSYRVGASSPSTFSREFKKQFGFPPSQVAGVA